MSSRPKLSLPNPRPQPKPLDPGDVVLANFPDREDLNDPSEKPRPCVVTGYCTIKHEITGAYVTRLSNASNTGGVEVTSPEDMNSAGFEYPSRIVAKRVQTFPNNDRYVLTHPEKGITIGKLSERNMDELRDLLRKPLKARFLAGDDLAEALRPALFALTRGWVNDVHGVTLENAGARQTIYLVDEVRVDFWAKDPDRPDQVLGADSVSIEAMGADTVMTATQRMTCVARMREEGRKVS